MRKMHKLLALVLVLLRQADVLQKGIQRQNLAAQILGLPEALLQALQGGNGQGPGFIQFPKPLPGSVLPLPAEALRASSLRTA